MNNKPQRDSQRKAIYDWEESLFSKAGSGDMTLDQCERLIAKVWKAYFLNDPPRVKDGRGTAMAFSRAGQEINLPIWARRRSVVLHELAHAILQRRGVCDQHGPLFAALFLELLQRFNKKNLPKGARTTAIHQKPRRVRFATKKQLDKALNHDH